MQQPTKTKAYSIPRNLASDGWKKGANSGFVFKDDN